MSKLEQYYRDKQFMFTVTFQSKDLDTASKYNDLFLSEKAKVRGILMRASKEIGSILHRSTNDSIANEID